MFFFLSKILWFVINPFNIILIFLISGWLLIYKKPKMAKWLVGAALFLIFLTGLSPLSDLMMHALENRIPAGTIPAKIDGIIVLAGMVDMEYSRGELIELTEQADRIVEGIILARKHPEARLIITGGSGNLRQGEKYREADYLKKLSISLGVDKDRLIVERDSRNTHEHAVAMSKMLYSKGQWVLITSAFHMPRSLGCFKKEGLNVMPYPVDYKTNLHVFNNLEWDSFLPTSGNQSRFSVALHEWLGLIAYRLSGFTDSFFPGI